MLDLACGRGRNARAVLAAGATLVGMDRDREHLRTLLATVGPGARAAVVQADLEAGGGIPAVDAAFGAVLVFRYLHRPLCPEIERVLAPGGWLLYETFTTGQRALGHGPRRAEFLLEPGELPSLFPGLRCERFEELLTAGERPAALARLLARKPG